MLVFSPRTTFCKLNIALTFPVSPTLNGDSIKSISAVLSEEVKILCMLPGYVVGTIY